MKREIAWLVLAVLVGACTKTTQPLHDKNTNWLRSCSAEAECGSALSCLCGLCTQACGSSAHCGEGEGASCVATASGALAAQCSRADAREAVAVCASGCKRDRDCAASGDDWQCRAGVCVAPASGPAPDSGTSPPDGDAGGARDSGAISNVDAGSAGGPLASELPACSEQPEQACILHSELATPTSGAIDAQFLYWTERGTEDSLGNYRFDGSVQAQPLAGGAAITLAAGQSAPDARVLHDDHAYWLNHAYDNERKDGAVMRVALSGGSPELVAGDLITVRGLAVDGTYVYFFKSVLNSEEQTLYRVPKDGSSGPEGLYLGVRDFRGSLLHDGGTLYWKSQGVLRAMPVSGGTPQDLSATRDGAASRNGGMVLVDDTFYWTWETVASCGVGAIARSGGDARLLALYETESSPSGLAVDATHVYWGHQRFYPGEGDSRWVLERSPRSPGVTEPLLEAQTYKDPQVVLGVDALYAIIPGDEDRGPTGSIVRIPK